MRISVAIDGPAGAGKSTIANLVANRFNLMYINTGSMYRAVALKAMREHIESTEIDKICNLISSLEMYFEGERLIVNKKDITEEIRLIEVSNNVSKYAAIPEVREILVKLQQNMADKFNVIMDGRDIGTVVLKNSPLKFFLTADAKERAKRRCNELKKMGVEVNFDDILNDILKRDYMDSNREINPLRKASDAVEIDSTTLSIEDVVEVISNNVESYIKNYKQKVK